MNIITLITRSYRLLQFNIDRHGIQSDVAAITLVTMNYLHHKLNGGLTRTRTEN